MIQIGPSAREETIGIVEKTDTATHAITAGQYVVWKGVSCVAASDISVGNTLSSSNLTAVSNGVANDIKNKIPSVSDSLSDTSTTNALSAAKGKALNDSLTTTNTNIGKLPYGPVIITSGDCDNFGLWTIYIYTYGSYPNIAHRPFDKGAVVFTSGENDSKLQIAYDRTSGVLYGISARSYVAGSGWSPWKELALMSDIKYLNTNLNYGGASIYSLMRTSLGKNEYLFLVEEIGTANYIFAHIIYDGSNLATKQIITSNGLTFGATNTGGTQVVNGYSGTGAAGTFRWSAW